MSELWLPILVSSAACFAICILAWGVTSLHADENRRLPTEPEVLDALRKSMPAPGIYTIPYRGLRGSNAARADVAANLARGPVGYIVVGKPGGPRIALALAQHFVFFVVVATLAAYLATISGLRDGSPFITVFRYVSTVSTMALVLGAIPQSIWFNRPWKSWLLQAIEGLAGGLATGAIFAWLWPQ